MPELWYASVAMEMRYRLSTRTHSIDIQHLSEIVCIAPAKSEVDGVFKGDLYCEKTLSINRWPLGVAKIQIQSAINEQYCSINNITVFFSIVPIRLLSLIFNVLQMALILLSMDTSRERGDL